MSDNDWESMAEELTVSIPRVKDGLRIARPRPRPRNAARTSNCHRDRPSNRVPKDTEGESSHQNLQVQQELQGISNQIQTLNSSMILILEQLRPKPPPTENTKPNYDAYHPDAVRRFWEPLVSPSPGYLFELFTGWYSITLNFLLEFPDPMRAQSRSLRHRGPLRESYSRQFEGLEPVFRFYPEEADQPIEIPWRYIHFIAEMPTLLQLKKSLPDLQTRWNNLVSEHFGKDGPHADELYPSHKVYIGRGREVIASLHVSFFDTSGEHTTRRRLFEPDMALFAQHTVESFLDKRRFGLYQGDEGRKRMTQLRNRREERRTATETPLDDGGSQNPESECPWLEKGFGAIWLFSSTKSFLSLPSIAVILSQLQPAGRTAVSRWTDDLSPHYLALYMLSRFTSRWPRTLPYSAGFRQTKGCFHLQFHARVFIVSGIDDILPTLSGVDGLECSRESGKVESFDGSQDFRVREQRFSVAFVGSESMLPPHYTIICLYDNDSWTRLEADDEDVGIKTEWKGELTGIAVYIQVLEDAIRGWDRKWNKVLDHIENTVKVELNDILDPESQRKFMFDTEFKLSQFYFSVLQMLRIFAESIKETEKELDNTRTQFQEFFFKEHLKPTDDFWSLSTGQREFFSVFTWRKKIDVEWETISTFQRNLANALLARIEKKTEEVSSLRDGLFNATSVREASKGTQLNQYIFIFTVMTIFYLPLSFVTSLFGMHLFDAPTTKGTQVSFYISTVLIAVVTWIVSGAGLYIAGDAETWANRFHRSLLWLRTSLLRILPTRFRQSDKSDASTVGSSYYDTSSSVSQNPRESKVSRWQKPFQWLLHPRTRQQPPVRGRAPSPPIYGSYSYESSYSSLPARWMTGWPSTLQVSGVGSPEEGGPPGEPPEDINITPDLEKVEGGKDGSSL